MIDAGASSLADYITAVESSATAQLLPHDERSDIVRLATTLPASPVAGFERRLGGGSARTDLAFHLEPGDKCFAALQSLLAYGQLAGAPWQAVEALLQADNSPAQFEIQNYWLEFDTSDGHTEPSVFVTPTSTEVSISALTRWLWTSTSSPPLSALQRDMIAELDAMDIRVLHVARMLARDHDGVRVCIAGLSPAAMYEWLARAGVDTSGLDRMAELQVGSYSSKMIFAADMGSDGVRSRFGIELQPPGPSIPPSQWWSGVLDALVADELCTDQERSDLLAWCGASSKATSPRWPADLQPAAMGAVVAEPVFDRRLHHLKLGFEGERVIAKIYYGFVVVWQTNGSAAD